MINLLIIFVLGVSIFLPTGRTPKLWWSAGIGITGLLIVTNWLSYAKYFPIRPFLGIEGLTGALVPLLFSLPFWLYQPFLTTKTIVVNVGKYVLMSTIL